jgi:hypothetical protein
MELQLTPQDKDIVALYGEDLDAATEAVLARLTAELRPKLRLQVQHEINWNATYRDILAREAASRHYLLCQPAPSSTSSRPVFESWRVPVDLLGDFCAHYRLDKSKVLRLANGELQDYKGWIQHPHAGGKYCLNARPKPATESLSLGEGVIGPLLPLGTTPTGLGDPRKPAPVLLPTKTYKE